MENLSKHLNYLKNGFCKIIKVLKISATEPQLKEYLICVLFEIGVKVEAIFSERDLEFIFKGTKNDTQNYCSQLIKNLNCSELPQAATHLELLLQNEKFDSFYQQILLTQHKEETKYVYNLLAQKKLIKFQYIVNGLCTLLKLDLIDLQQFIIFTIKKEKKLLTMVIEKTDCDTLSKLSFSGGKTLAHLAVKHKNTSVIKILVLKGVNIDCMDQNRITPLMLAVSGKRMNETRYEIAELLIKKGVDLSNADIEGRTILHYVVCLPDSDESFNLLHLLPLKQPQAFVRDIYDKTPLDYAIDSNNLEKAHLLAFFNLEPEKYEEPVWRVNISQLRGADLDKMAYYCRRAYEKTLQIPEYLQTCGFSELHMAVIDNNVKRIMLLIVEGANVNERDNDQNTPLHIACTLNIQTFRILLEHGADINTANVDDETVLHIIYKNFRRDEPFLLEMLEMLIPYGIDATIVSKEGLCPIKELMNSENLEVKEIVTNWVTEGQIRLNYM